MKLFLTVLLACATLSITPITAVAQAPDTMVYRSSPPLVKYGKWVLLAAALGMGYQAVQSHNDADHAFTRLEDYCFPSPERCDRQASGRYIDPQSESLYQNSLSHDRKSRAWLIGGEVSLLGAAGLFIWELSRPKRPSPNIPFEPTVNFRGPITDVGFKLSF